MDQKKLDEVKRVLKTPTETEAVDAALEEIAFRDGLVDAIRTSGDSRPICAAGGSSRPGRKSQ